MPKTDNDNDASKPEEEAFLNLLEADINAGAATPMDPALAERMSDLVANIVFDIDAPIEGDVEI
jgi:hypothetical protein